MSLHPELCLETFDQTILFPQERDRQAQLEHLCCATRSAVHGFRRRCRGSEHIRRVSVIFGDRNLHHAELRMHRSLRQAELCHLMLVTSSGDYRQLPVTPAKPKTVPNKDIAR